MAKCWTINLATVILCKKRIIRPGTMFNFGQGTLRTSKPEPEFEPDTSWYIVRNLTTRQTGEYHRALQQRIESA